MPLLIHIENTKNNNCQFQNSLIKFNLFSKIKKKIYDYILNKKLL